MTWAAKWTLAMLATARFGVAQHYSIGFSDADRAGQVKAELMNGSIEVQGYDGKTVVIEPLDPSGRRKAGNDVSATESGNVLTIHGGASNSGRLKIRVPHRTALWIRCVNCGEVSVSGVSADMDIDVVNGAIRLIDTGGSVVAHSLNGKVTAVLDGLGSKPSSFSSLNGSIDLTLPPDTKANVRLRSEHGKVQTEFELRLQGALRTDRGFVGTINGGGPEIQARTFNGSIYLRKKTPSVP